MDSIDKELRIGNWIIEDSTIYTYGTSKIERQIELYDFQVRDKDWSDHWDMIKPIPITKENIEKYIDWSFEFGFNKSFESKKNITTSSFLMENIIAGSSDFEIRFIEDQIDTDNTTIVYLYDNDYINFGLDDTLHNLQNLFFISTGQELPIKKKF